VIQFIRFIFYQYWFR